VGNFKPTLQMVEPVYSSMGDNFPKPTSHNCNGRWVNKYPRAGIGVILMGIAAKRASLNPW